LTRKLPTELKDGFYCEALPNGLARIHTVRRGKIVGYLDFPEAKLGTLAATLLQFASMLASQRLGPGDSLLGSDFTEPPITATRAGLVDHPNPDMQVLAFQVGEAQIGFEIPQRLLREMGETFLAASVRKKDAAH
jgi:hypothetical protein